jgi:arsenate reductase (thioredoxin)
LFICVGNSGRSQMAEAFFERTGSGWNSMSAGTEPDKSIHPMTVEVMKEVGIDVSQGRPKRLTTRMLQLADKVIVMDSLIVRQIPSQYLSKTENWKITPLLGKDKAQAEEVRDEIRRKVERLSRELDLPESERPDDDGTASALRPPPKFAGSNPAKPPYPKNQLAH